MSIHLLTARYFNYPTLKRNNCFNLSCERALFLSFDSRLLSLYNPPLEGRLNNHQSKIVWIYRGCLHWERKYLRLDAIVIALHHNECCLLLFACKVAPAFSLFPQSRSLFTSKALQTTLDCQSLGYVLWRHQRLLWLHLTKLRRV